VKLASQANARRLTDTSEFLGHEEVDFFMEGTVLLADDRVTLEVRVVEADDDVTLYSQQWQGSLDQLDGLEQTALDEITDYVVTEL
jgi:TolB-like protein